MNQILQDNHLVHKKARRQGDTEARRGLEIINNSSNSIPQERLAKIQNQA